MDTKLAQIYQTLQKLVGFHRQLLEIVRLERDALLNADLKVIQDCTFAKEGLIETIRQAEAERIKHVTELAMMWKKPLRDLTITNIAIEIQGRDLKAADQLRSAHTALTVILQRITEQNRANGELVERSLKLVEQMKKNVLGEATPKANTYNPQGQKSSGAPGARLFSREA